jgi:2-methylcitrate dehydratase
MEKDNTKQEKKDEVPQFGPSLDRRDLMKMGAGAVLAALGGAEASAQERARAARSSSSDRGSAGGEGQAADSPQNVKTGVGYKNNANRIGGNGPMDNTTRQVVEYVSSFSESQLNPAILKVLGMYMIDTLAAQIAGFETDSGRICAKLGKQITHSELKSTILGYGVTTSPHLAALANTLMNRHKDFNAGPEHSAVTIPGILAIGEALHSTGRQVLAATALGVEVMVALNQAEPKTAGLGTHFDNRYYGVSTAMSVGKLLGLNQDQLANALSIALVPHTPLAISHVGALSHFKNMHAAIPVMDGVFAAMLAREGMTGPAQPFEGRFGFWDSVTGPYKPLHLPVQDGHLVVEEMTYKRRPSDGDHQALLDEAIPAIRQWAKPDEIESINFEVPWSHWQENADPPKWDPHNSETADHSLPYVMAVALIDGDIYLDAYTPKRYLQDAKVRQLMERITCTGNESFSFHQSRTTVRKKSGEQMVKDVLDYRPMTNDEVVAKFKRVCGYIGVSDAQRDRALATWADLQNVKDIAEPMRDLAHFGKPQPL